VRGTTEPFFEAVTERKKRFTWKHYVLIVLVLALLIAMGVVYARWRNAQSASPPVEQPTNQSEQQSAPQQQLATAPVEVDVLSKNDDAELPKAAPPKPKEPTDSPPANTNTAVRETESREQPAAQPAEQPAAREQPKEEVKKEPPPETKPEEKPPDPPPSPKVIEGQILKQVAPVYPSEARARRVSGEVLVEVEITKKGKVKSARAVSGHILLREAAVTAAKKWKFTPATLNGQPVKTTRTLTFRFQ
jgi:protein TonB